MSQEPSEDQDNHYQERTAEGEIGPAVYSWDGRTQSSEMKEKPQVPQKSQQSSSRPPSKALRSRPRHQVPGKTKHLEAWSITYRG